MRCKRGLKKKKLILRKGKNTKLFRKNLKK